MASDAFLFLIAAWSTLPQSSSVVYMFVEKQ